MTPTDIGAIATLVRQHAATARLLGVDFVPAFRRGPIEGMVANGLVDHDSAHEGATTESPARQAHATPELSEDAPSPRSILDRPAQQIEHKPASSRAAVRVGAPAIDSSASLPSEQAQAALDELRARYVEAAPHKPFIKSFTNIVFGEGDPRARLMFLGEAPGEEEDRTGRPFVGRAGQLLEKMIQAMGLSRERVYICNVLKVRPPNNATPTLEEAEASEPFLHEQIDIVAPEVIVTLGKSAAQCLLKTSENMTSMRGSWRTFRTPAPPFLGRPVAVMPTFHPAFLLRSYTPENRAKVWSDLQQVMDRLGMPKVKAGAE